MKYPSRATALVAAVAAALLVWRGLETFAHLPVSTAELITLPGYPLAIDSGSLQRVTQLMLTFGMLSHNFSVGQMLR